MKRVENVFKLGLRRRYLTVAALALAAMCAFYISSAFGDAGNPILGTINGTIAPNLDGTVTVTVRGQWHWYSHNSDCNTDRAGAGVGIIWNDPTEPGYTVTKGSISQGVGISTLRAGDTTNTIDQMVHPSDVGNKAEGYPGFTGQTFVDPSPPSPNSYLSWKGGCGREPETATASPGPGSALNPSGITCADGTLICGGAAGTDPATGIKYGANSAGHPWGSWGYTKAYSHTYAKRSDITTVCVNYYDVHGGGTGTKLQLVNGAKEITVNGNGDNSIQTNAFNPAQGANCISFPSVQTAAVTPVVVGSNISDTATVSGTNSGQVTYVQFHLFAPGDTSCTGTDLYTGGRKSVTGNGSVTSDSFQTTQTGDYHWTAELFDAASGGNKLAATSCGDAGETSHVTPAGPKIVTSASGPVTIGGSISDTATISGLVLPDGTGTITFTAYAPKADGSADTACSTAVYTKTVTGINANGSYGSDSFMPSGVAPQIAGTYEWIASFSGDGNNSAASTKCGDSGEQSVVNRHPSTVPTGQKVLISDFAKVSSTLGTPTGTVDFQLFDNSTCTGNPLYDSGAVTLVNGLAHADDPNALSANGTYYWQVTYTPSSGSSFTGSSSPCGTEQTSISGNTPGVDP